MKRFLALLLSPFARLADAAGGLSRLWAWTRLKIVIPELSEDCVVLGSIEIHGSRRIKTGRGLYLYRDLYFETVGHGEIEIGDRVVMSRGVHLVAFAGIRIGAGTMIGEYASIRDANHQYRNTSDLRDAPHDARPVSIGSNVWIGRGAIVLPGVHVGDRAVIGANAVVTRDVAPGAVVAGVPARPLATGVNRS
ncbi:MAG: acyltransferase [Pseudohongiella sp.]|nr:acyltransferase [Pseudohongiella sp.]